MTDWTDVKSKITGFIDKIQNNPLTDALAQEGLPLIPLAGPVLLKLYEKYKDSKTVSIEDQICQILNTMKILDSKKLEAFCEGIEKNEKDILNDLSFIRGMMANMQSMIEGIKEDTTDIKNQCTEMSQNIVMMRKIDEKMLPSVINLEKLLSVVVKKLDVKVEDLI